MPFRRTTSVGRSGPSVYSPCDRKIGCSASSWHAGDLWMGTHIIRCGKAQKDSNDTEKAVGSELGWIPWLLSGSLPQIGMGTELFIDISKQSVPSILAVRNVVRRGIQVREQLGGAGKPAVAGVCPEAIE